MFPNCLLTILKWKFSVTGEVFNVDVETDLNSSSALSRLLQIVISLHITMIKTVLGVTSYSNIKMSAYSFTIIFGGSKFHVILIHNSMLAWLDFHFLFHGHGFWFWSMGKGFEKHFIKSTSARSIFIYHLYMCFLDNVTIQMWNYSF